jgi:hypothetical protein
MAAAGLGVVDSACWPSHVDRWWHCITVSMSRSCVTKKGLDANLTRGCRCWSRTA